MSPIVGLERFYHNAMDNPADSSPVLSFPENSPMRNYDIGNKELLSMKAAIEEWRHWLEGATHPFLVITDHKNLEYIKAAKRLNPRQARWSLFFTRFQFAVTYRPGSKNGKADALSRRHDLSQHEYVPVSILPPSVIIAPVTWDLMEEIQREQQVEPTPPQCPRNKQYVPQSLRVRVMQWVHTSLSADTLVSQVLFIYSKTCSGGHQWEKMLRTMLKLVKSALSPKH